MTGGLRAHSLPVNHGFGTRESDPPNGLRRPRQVHGAAVTFVQAPGEATLGEADVVICDDPRVPVGIVTADCVPILVASRDGRVVAAIHGGWRGLGAGVVGAGVAALREIAGHELVAAMGPHVGPCCYEVDAPVLDALGECFGTELEEACRPSRAGHVWLDLGTVAEVALRQAEVSAIERLPDVCTACPEAPFFSVRRDGAGTGRLVHWIQATGSQHVPPGANQP